jgi:hypothetical protein
MKNPKQGSTKAKIIHDTHKNILGEVLQERLHTRGVTLYLLYEINIDVIFIFKNKDKINNKEQFLSVTKIDQ